MFAVVVKWLSIYRTNKTLLFLILAQKCLIMLPGFEGLYINVSNKMSFEAPTYQINPHELAAWTHNCGQHEQNYGFVNVWNNLLRPNYPIYPKATTLGASSIFRCFNCYITESFKKDKYSLNRYLTQVSPSQSLVTVNVHMKRGRAVSFNSSQIPHS